MSHIQVKAEMRRRTYRAHGRINCKIIFSQLFNCLDYWIIGLLNDFYPVSIGVELIITIISEGVLPRTLEVLLLLIPFILYSL